MIKLNQLAKLIIRYVFVTLFALIFVWFGVFFYNQYISPQHNYKIANQENIKLDLARKLTPVFVPSGINDIALITMVKDESDIIFENLVWHFCIGFRKFFIIDNKSTDGTRQIIDNFAKLTNNKAAVFILDDPIEAYIQSKITTGSYNFVKSVWPEVNWIFPVDGDEFWLPEKNLSEILKEIPGGYDSINTLRFNYKPTDDYYNFDITAPFYKKLHYREKQKQEPIDKFMSKAAIRATNKNLEIVQGNHYIVYNQQKFLMFLRRIKFLRQIEVASGNILGLQMVEYPMRSPKQTYKKLYNAMKAHLKADEQNLIRYSGFDHWNKYKEDLKKNNQEDNNKRFAQYMIKTQEAIDDPLPINQALELFKKIIDNR